MATRRFHSRSKCLAAVVGCMALVAASGCGRSGPEIGRVSGLVTLDGQPLPEAFVFFKHAEGGRIARAITDEQAAYVLNFSNEAAGAIVGENTVRISTFVEVLRDDDGRLIKGTGKKELVPTKYNQQSELTADVRTERMNSISNYRLDSPT